MSLLPLVVLSFLFLWLLLLVKLCFTKADSPLFPALYPSTWMLVCPVGGIVHMGSVSREWSRDIWDISYLPLLPCSLICVLLFPQLPRASLASTGSTGWSLMWPDCSLCLFCSGGHGSSLSLISGAPPTIICSFAWLFNIAHAFNHDSSHDHQEWNLFPDG